ncbi:MAG: glycosyltransferase family 4 protein [Patescibacteria group bacterium]|jgi:glycosyltransferase involved in cell wall biosynthesis
MKILQINKFHYLRGGAERCYFETGRILEEHGHEVACFSMDHPENIESRRSKYFSAHIDFYAKQNLFKKIIIAFNILYNRKAAKNLEKLIKEFQPDVAHLHNIYHQLSPSIIWTLKKNKIPMVMTLHDYKLISPAYNLFSNGKIYERACGGKFYRCFFDKCVNDSYSASLVVMVEAYLHKFLKTYYKVDAFIAPTKSLRDKFYQFGFKPEIFYLPNPLKVKNEIKNAETDFFGEEFVLYAGRLAKEKGVDILIQAAALQKNKINITIAGEGPERENLQKLAHDLKLENRVKFTGFLNEEKLNFYRKNALAVVVPSICHENGPYSLREALALTKVTISAKVDGISELVKDGVGLCYEPHNAEQLAALLDKAATHDPLIKEVEHNLKKLNLKQDNSEDYYNELMKIYSKISHS